MPSFRNVRPCTFVGYEFAGKLASVWNHGHPRPRMYIRVHLWATSLQANSLLLNFTDIPVRSEKPFTISFFANSLSGSVHPCTLPDASFCCAKTSLLIRTPDIPVRSETTRREHKLTAGTLKNERPCSFFSCEFAVRTRFCLEPLPSVAVLQILLPLAFLKIDGTDTRREQK